MSIIVIQVLAVWLFHYISIHIFKLYVTHSLNERFICSIYFLYALCVFSISKRRNTTKFHNSAPRYDYIDKFFCIFSYLIELTISHSSAQLNVFQIICSHRDNKVFTM